MSRNCIAYTVAEHEIHDCNKIENIIDDNKDIIFNKIENIELDKANYDFCLLRDVLHHIGVEKILELKNLIYP